MRWLVALGLVGLLIPDALAGDAVTVSRSRGKKGGVVVLWPREVPGEVPAEQGELAAALQARMAEVAGRLGDSPKVSVRPEPERVCPHDGCLGVSLGAVLGYHEGGCFAVALVGGPKGQPQRLVPWAGDVSATRKQVPYGEPPESDLIVNEFVPCGQLIEALDDRRLEKALTKALEAPQPRQE